MLYLYEPKLIMNLRRVYVLASTGLSEPPLVDGHGISITQFCVLAQLECKPWYSRKVFKIVKNDYNILIKCIM